MDRHIPFRAVLFFGCWMLCAFTSPQHATAGSQNVYAVYLQKYGVLAGYELQLKGTFRMHAVLTGKSNLRWFKVFLPHATFRLTTQGQLFLEELQIKSNLRLQYDNNNRIVKMGNISFVYRQDGRLKRMGSMNINYDISGRMRKLGSFALTYQRDGSLKSINTLTITINHISRLTAIGPHKVLWQTNGRIQQIGPVVVSYHPIQGTVVTSSVQGGRLPFRFSVFWDNRSVCQTLMGKTRR